MNRREHPRSGARAIRRLALVLTVVVAGSCALTGVAQAASPAWKLLAVTGPTNLPPKQSEIQRITVGEAEGGTFMLTLAGGEGEGSPVTATGHLTFQAEATTATIVDGTFEVGEKISGLGLGGGVPGTIVEGCSPDCTTPGSVLILSLPTTAAKTGQKTTIFHKELASVSGTFHAGEELSGSYLQEGTIVTSVGAGTLGLNKSPYLALAMKLQATELTPPITFGASAEAVKGALEALAPLGNGSVNVVGGPEGGTQAPYFVDFTGSLADTDVAQLGGRGGGLEGEHAYVHVFTVTPGGAGTGEIAIAPANVGGAPTVGEATVEVGPLPAGVVFSGETKSENWTCPGAAGTNTAVCTTSVPVAALGAANSLKIPVEVQSTGFARGEVPVSISGGMARPDTYSLPVNVSAERAPFGAQAFWASQFNENGELETRAGAHPYSAMSYIELNTIRDARGEIVPSADSKDVYVDLSPGFVGNPMVTKRCPQSQLIPDGNAPETTCGNEMYIGKFEPIIGHFAKASREFLFPIYNDVPARGYAAEFTTLLAFPIQTLLASVRNESDYGVRITGPNNPNYYKIYGSYAALEGFPQGSYGKPFLTNASDCANEQARPPRVYAKADTWENPGEFFGQEAALEPVHGCNELEFKAIDPSTGKGQVGFTFQPTSTTGSSPVGIDAHLHIDQKGLVTANQLATPDLKKAVVKLPEGLVLNPSSANGLEACTEAEMGYRGSEFEEPNPIRFSGEAPKCPDGSKLGTVEVESPLLEGVMPGTIYLASQYENPFGSLLGIYLVINDERHGILIKLPGELETNSNTGQLTATFDHNPQLPFENMTLHFRGGGPQSELATPEVCGNYSTVAEWTPWSAPESGPPAQTSDPFTVSGNCASSLGTRPFSPSFEAGTVAPRAGAYSPLVIKIARKDGEQELTSLDFTLPKGLLGKLAGIPYCSDAAIAAAEQKTGKDEQANPSCPAASQIGTVDTAAGVGSEPFHVGGKLYLAGPYKGAPVSSVVISPAVAGPLDLGDVVVRAPLYVNHETAELTAKSDPIPTILRGIPLKVRAVNINVDKPGFILNPTNCTPMTASASIRSGNGATSNSTTRFQVGNCDNLKFTPKLRIRLKGRTKRAGTPALTAILTQPEGQANIGYVSVALPRSEFLEQGHIRTVCTRVQFSAEQCPTAAIYGHAEATTPLLDQPLSGPVYLRSSSHRLPDLVAVLKGPPTQPIEIDLDGRIDSFKGGIRTTFEAVPDAPVSKFVLKMQGGKKGLLVNSTNICKGKHKATVEATGQNGTEYNFLRAVEPQCKKKKGGKKKSKSKGGKK
ncbi:MAG TPA: hypothetical protein VHB53_09285 [Solirubrobacterales bacterium]|nr:hypothetical protein [Solirubrobacterales bacterium]